MHVEGIRIDTPEQRGFRDGKALAYVRPHDLTVERYTPGATGIVATLSRAIVVGPIARLELEPVESNPDNPGSGTIIEAQLPAQQFRDLGLQRGRHGRRHAAQGPGVRRGLGFTLIDWYFGAPRRALALICAACVAMLAFGMYLQHVVGLEPCPMCIVQRYALVLVALFAGLAALQSPKGIAGDRARCSASSWPSAAPTPPHARAGCNGIRRRSCRCGRDIYGMIEDLPAAARAADDLPRRRRLFEGRLDLPGPVDRKLVLHCIHRLRAPAAGFDVPPRNFQQSALNPAHSAHAMQYGVALCDSKQILDLSRPALRPFSAVSEPVVETRRVDLPGSSGDSKKSPHLAAQPVS